MNLREWARATHKVLNSRSAEERYLNITAVVVEQVMRASISVLVEALASGERLSIDELGQLWVDEKRPQRIVSNLTTVPKIYKVKSHRIVRFRTSKCLSTKINNRTDEES